jgi:quinolinate synthase
MSLGLPLVSCSIEGTEIDDEYRERIILAKAELGDQVMILGHHYQRDSIIEHADVTGDSFRLSRMAADSTAEQIVFCGVHFMAESADILTNDFQTVSMPTTRAGCSMADMANLPDVEECWHFLIEELGLSDPEMRSDPDEIAEESDNFLVPVTYMNSSAALKAFVGRHGGIVCTSTNAKQVLEWALSRAGGLGKVLFFPDQHLGRNTALKMGFQIEDMMVWDPKENAELVSPEEILIQKNKLNDARFVLWHGYCSVHQRFTVDQIERLRKSSPDALIVVHPECDVKVVQSADADGSTDFIRRFCDDAPSGSIIGVGTEINLVQRLNSKYPDKEILCLDDSICPCSTMYMIHPRFLAEQLESIIRGEKKNIIKIDKNTSAYAILALNRMLEV